MIPARGPAHDSGDDTTQDAAPGDAPLRVLVVDDDASARAHIVDVLRGRRDFVVAGECADGEAAATAIVAERPDLVVLDVQMPGLDGFGVVARVGVDRMPATVFASAYAEFAVRAFEAYAVDYVLKPFDDVRLSAALERARDAVLERRRTSVATPAVDARLEALLAQLDRLGAVPASAAARYPDALAVKAGDRYVVVRTVDVDWISADGNYARLHVGERTRTVARSLATLERDVLDPSRFVRVHRSAIVNVAKVVSVEPVSHGDLTLVLQGNVRVDCSRRFRARLEARLYFTT